MNPRRYEPLEWRQFKTINSFEKNDRLIQHSIIHSHTYFTNIRYSCYSVFSSKYRANILLFAVLCSTLITFLLQHSTGSGPSSFFSFVFPFVLVGFILQVISSNKDAVADFNPKAERPVVWNLKTALVAASWFLDVLYGVSLPFVCLAFSSVISSYSEYLKDWQYAVFLTLICLYCFAISFQYALLMINIVLIVCFIVSCFLEFVINVIVWKNVFMCFNICRETVRGWF